MALSCWGILSQAVPRPLDCASFWGSGFPISSYRTYPCYEYATVSRDPSDTHTKPDSLGPHHIYYSANYMDDNTGELKTHMVAVMERIRQAVADSQKVYSARGALLPVAVVVMDSADKGGDGVSSVDAHPNYPEPLPLLVGSNFFNAPINQQPQLVAREMWHAVLNLRYLSHWSREIPQWWVNGSSEFFSNLVYPSTNYEWRLSGLYDWVLQPFAQVHPDSSAIFFQSVANGWFGIDGVLNFLDEIPKEGPETKDTHEQWKALSQSANTSMAFGQFAQQFTTGKISDSGGGFLPTHYVPPEPQPLPANSFKKLVQPEPFVIKEVRYSLPSGQKWTIDTNAGGSYKTQISEMQVGQDSSWQMMFPGHSLRFDLTCKEGPKIVSFLVVSTEAPLVRIPDVEISGNAEPVTCPCAIGGAIDQNLAGHWKLRDNTIKDVMQSYMKAGTTIQNVTGTMWLDLDIHHSIKITYDNLTIDAVTADGIQIHVLMNGLGAGGKFDATKTDQLCLRSISGGGQSETTVTMPGQPPIRSQQPLPQFFNEGGSLPISLHQNVLTVRSSSPTSNQPITLMFDLQ